MNDENHNQKEDQTIDEPIQKKKRGRPKKNEQQKATVYQPEDIDEDALLARVQNTPPRTPYTNMRIKKQKDDICDLIAEGCSFSQAASLIGVSQPVFTKWRKEDENFCNDIMKAMEAWKLHHIRNIQMHSQTDWKASKFLLERKFPNEFGEKTFQQIEQVGEREDSFAAQLLKQLLPNSPPSPTTFIQSAPINPNWIESSPIDELQIDPLDIDQVDSNVVTSNDQPIIDYDIEIEDGDDDKED